MFIHHLVTILLLTFSWACNFVRIGTLVLVIHDFADIPLEGAKICRYIKASDLVSNSVFGVFTLSWIFSRLGLLPTRVIAYTSFYGLQAIEMFPAYYIFNALLICLQVLHVIWTILILRIAYNAIYADGVKDLREDSSVSEDSSSSELTPVDDGSETTGSIKRSSGGDGRDAGDGLVRRRGNPLNNTPNGAGDPGNHFNKVNGGSSTGTSISASSSTFPSSSDNYSKTD